MLIVTPDRDKDKYINFFPSYDISFFDFTKIRTNQVLTQITGQDLVVVIGTQEFATEFGSSYEYENFYTTESVCRYIFDYSIDLKIPLLGINYGMSLICVKSGNEFRTINELDNHLVLYNGNYYAVNSKHKINIFPYRNSKYKYDIIDGNFCESMFIPSYKILGIRWNPELDDCPQSGKDLFDIYLEKTLGIKR